MEKQNIRLHLLTALVILILSNNTTHAGDRPAALKMAGIHESDFFYAVTKNMLQPGCTALQNIDHINIRNEHQNGGLHVAAINGYLETTQILLAIGGIDVEMLGEHDLSPLQRAGQYGHLSVVKALIEDGHAQIDNQGGSWQRTALHVAAECGHLSIVEYLISKGANLNLQDKDGFTPISLVVYQTGLKIALKTHKIDKLVAVAHYLINHPGTDLTSVDKNRDTVLHHAVRTNLYDLVLALTNADHRLQYIPNIYNKLPAYYAKNRRIKLLCCGSHNG